VLSSERCVREGVLYVPGSYAFAAEPGPVPNNHARICFGVPGESALEQGIHRLAKALAGCLHPVCLNGRTAERLGRGATGAVSA